MENLIMVRDIFRERMSLMNPQDKSHIFHLWDDLILLHSDILFGLKTPKNDDIGKVFLRHMPRITHLYGRYVPTPHAYVIEGWVEYVF